MRATWEVTAIASWTEEALKSLSAPLPKSWKRQITMLLPLGKQESHNKLGLSRCSNQCFYYNGKIQSASAISSFRQSFQQY